MTDQWFNTSGKPLSSFAWLDAHHRAKLPERSDFARRLALLEPRRVVDLGCGSGLWLSLLDEVLPESCELIGIDTDAQALAAARARASTWSRDTAFLNLNFELDVAQVPPADLTLAFNVFPYVADLPQLLKNLANRTPRGVLAVRQYDGDTMRFGPLPPSKRLALETSVYAATGSSGMFHHYDMDRVFGALHDSPYSLQQVSFELFQRVSPFPDEFTDYFESTLDWNRQMASEESALHLDSWRESNRNSPRYFFGVDLVALLS